MEEIDNPYLDALCDVLDELSQEDRRDVTEISQNSLEATDEGQNRNSGEDGRQRLEATEDNPDSIEATEVGQNTEEVQMNILNKL